MTPATRTLAAAVVSGAAVLGMTFAAVPAVAHPGSGGDPNHHGHQLTLGQVKKLALHGLGTEITVLNRFEAQASADPYVRSAAQAKAIHLAEQQQSRDRVAEAKVHAAKTKDQVSKAVWAAHAVKHADHHGHQTLAQQKDAAQLMLDSRKAVLIQRAVTASKAQPKLKATIKSIPQTKKAVDGAKTEKQVQNLVGRDCGGHQGR